MTEENRWFLFQQFCLFKGSRRIFNFFFSASFKYCCKYLSVTRQNKNEKKEKRLERSKKFKDLIYCFKYLSNLFTSRTIEHIGIWIKDTAEIVRQFWCCLGLSKKVWRMVRFDDMGHTLSPLLGCFLPSLHFILLLEHCSFHVGKADRPGPAFRYVSWINLETFLSWSLPSYLVCPQKTHTEPFFFFF